MRCKQNHGFGGDQQLMKLLVKNNIFTPSQHRSRINKGCETQLGELILGVSTILDNANEIETCLLDFSKAFDNVKHSTLTSKLFKIWVPTSLVMVDIFVVKQHSADGETSEEIRVTPVIPRVPLLTLVCLHFTLITSLNIFPSVPDSSRMAWLSTILPRTPGYYISGDVAAVGDILDALKYYKDVLCWWRCRSGRATG